MYDGEEAARDDDDEMRLPTKTPIAMAMITNLWCDNLDDSSTGCSGNGGSGHGGSSSRSSRSRSSSSSSSSSKPCTGRLPVRPRRQRPVLAADFATASIGVRANSLRGSQGMGS